MDLLRVNNAQLNSDLEVKFLSILSREVQASAHTGMLLDFADSPRELFGSPSGDVVYQEVSVGVSRGNFYSAKDWPYFAPCFFPRVTPSFWQLFDRAEHTSWYKILYSDALALYLDPYREDFESEMETLFKVQPLPGAHWLKEVLKIYRAVIVSVGDMNFFKVYTGNIKDTEILDGSLKEIEDFVAHNEWYRANKDDLTWDSEYAMCFRLKK